MQIHANQKAQERFALRKAEKVLEQSGAFSAYIEAARNLTETETKKSEYRRYVSESGVRNDLADIMLDNYLDDILENNDLFGGLSFNYNFLNFLNKNSLKSEEDELLNVAPGKWLKDWTGESPVKKAVQYLSKMGIDAESRKPAYSLTDEQKEWLRSRHDLDAIYNRTSSTLDEYSFRADLVYLGAISPREAENVWTIAIPAHCGLNGLQLLDVENTGGNYLDRLRYMISKQKTVVDYMLEKYSDPRRREAEDLRFIETANKDISSKELYINLMEKLLG